ncbi:MAG: hypothetical protein sGL2_04310 [Candidatus Mesenet longicola]|nr:MAG: hypothetical protein sGL2_04310 [Candidatus Mesenet longicola]
MSILNKIIQFFTRVKKWFTGCFILKKDKVSNVNYYDDTIGSVSGSKVGSNTNGKKFNPRSYTSSAYSQQKQPDSTKDTDASLNTKKTGFDSKKEVVTLKVKDVKYGQWEWHTDEKLYSRSVTLCYNNNKKEKLPTQENDKSWLLGLVSSSSCFGFRYHSHIYNRQIEDIKIIELRLKKVDSNTKTNYGNTPLHEAILLGNLPAIKLLLDNGASLFIKNRWGITPYSLLLDHSCYDKERIMDLLSSDEEIKHKVRKQERDHNILETITNNIVSSNLRLEVQRPEKGCYERNS